ncbi:phosphoribosylpyrophosphate synthetase [bacterium]|jgi:hypothetical protein|nr:phosphoribosylpyrophosphate synthetase [bacterium]
MEKEHYSNLMEAINALTDKGYTEDFNAEGDQIVALISGKTFTPEELHIDEIHRFEGDTDPADSSELFAISAKSGLKGTLSMAHGAKHGQNADLIKRISSDHDH